MPRSVVEKVQRDVRSALNTAAVRYRLAEMHLRGQRPLHKRQRRSQDDFAK